MSDVGIVNLVSATFERCLVPGGAVAGEAAWACEDRTVIWRADATNMPNRAPYRFEVDEAVYVLEGSVDITFDDGKIIHLDAGDLAHFPGGRDSSWHFHFPFAKVSVLIGEDRSE